VSLVDRYRSWFEYEMDAHRRTLAALDSVPPEDRNERYQKALDHFAHLMACRRMWLHRLGAVPSGPAGAEEIFPSATDRDGLEDQLEAMAADWRPYLEQLDHAELGRDFEYASTEGNRFGNSVEEILTQLFGHAWHHRGQIMSIVRECGGEPTPADFVFWSRRALD
jgi:uncharacterized damage-inducible protein DinB